jgi:hypothetical protein
MKSSRMVQTPEFASVLNAHFKRGLMSHSVDATTVEVMVSLIIFSVEKVSMRSWRFDPPEHCKWTSDFSKAEGKATTSW